MQIDLLSCNWEPAKYLIFSGNVYDHLIYYSHLVPLALSLIVGLFVFLNNRKNLINKVLFFLTIAFSIWVLFDLILWSSEKIHYIMFFWSTIVAVELLFYVSALYLVYLYIYKKDVTFLIKIIGSLLFIPIILFAHTHYNLTSFDFTNCDRGALEGALITYLYIIEALIIIWIIVVAIIGYKKTDNVNKRPVLLFSSAIIVLLLTFSIGNFLIFMELDWRLEQYKLFGMPVFVGLLAYLIVKYGAFNIKLIAAQAIIIALVILIASQFAFISNPTNRLLNGVTLFFAVVFGWQLVRSVKNEVAQKEELIVVNEKLRKIDQAKSEFISIASHQLRTPLTVIKGYISMIIDGTFGPMNPKIKDSLVRVESSNERLIKLVEDLLNVSRIESGRLKYNFERKQLEDLVASVCDELKENARRKGLNFEYFPPKQKLPPVVMDEEKLRQAIMNLIDNSIKYTAKGIVTVMLKKQENGILFCVSDTGIGVRAEDIPNLFKKFSRGTGTSLIHTEGTGLGLFVVKQMIEAHGGRTWLESAGEGRGSKFYFVIPFAK
jgi:signal transduction histidine kinase